MKIFLTFLMIIFSSPIFGLVEAKETKLGNIQIAYVKDNSSRIVSVSMVFKGAGSRMDPVGREGLGWVALQSIYQGGSSGLDQQAFEKELVKLGVLYGIRLMLDHDDINLDFECPKENLKKAFELVAQMILKPNLPQNVMDRVKQSLPPGVSLAQANEYDIANKILRNKIYGTHFYGRMPATFEGMQPINQEEIQNALNNRFVQESLYLAIVGDVSESDILTALKGTLTKLPEKSVTSITIEKPMTQFDGSIGFIPKDSTQSGVAFAQKAVRINDKSYWALRILTQIIGGSEASRLWEDLREKQGLVYSIGASISESDLDALFMGGFSCSFDRVVESIQHVKQIWTKIQETGVTEQEFIDAKTALTGSYAIAFTSFSSIAQLLMNYVVEGMGADYVLKRNLEIEKVTLEDVNRVAKELLTPKELTFVIVGKPEEKLMQFLKQQQVPSQ